MIKIRKQWNVLVSRFLTFTIILLIPTLSLAKDISVYYGGHTKHFRVVKRSRPASKKKSLHNQNNVLGLSYKDIAFTTYRNSQKSSIRNYTLTYESEYWGAGVVYGYDKAMITGEKLDKDNYKSTLLPMVYLKIPYYTFKTQKVDVQLMSILSYRVINTGLRVRF